MIAIKQLVIIYFLRYDVGKMWASPYGIHMLVLRTLTPNLGGRNEQFVTHDNIAWDTRGCMITLIGFMDKAIFDKNGLIYLTGLRSV